MRKAYIQPDAQVLSLKFLEDFLLLSPENPLDPDGGDDNDNGMGGSSGSITPDRPGIF